MKHSNAAKFPPMPPAVAQVFESYPPALATKLRVLRQLILETSESLDGVGPLTETLKWGEPAYLTTASKSGSTIRLGCVRGKTDQFALYFNCNTTLVSTFRREFAGHFSFEGNRAICFGTKDRLPKKLLSQCIATALTYHLRK